MSNSEAHPTTPPPPTMRPMVGTPSFVWVKSPHSATTHQAELLQIGEEGYLVKWCISGKQEWISTESHLQQELPTRRTRRRSSMLTETDSDDGEEPPKRSRKTKEPPQTPLLIDTTAKSRVVKRSAEEDEEYVEPTTKSSKKKKPKKKQKTTAEKDQENKHIFWKSQPRTSDGKFASSPKPASANASATRIRTTPSQPEQCLNLFKLHKLVRTKTEESVAQLLEPFGYSSAASFVTEFFLFCCERQSCWVRRNNEENPIWSDSTIFQNYFFTNVYRELDRGTCYIRSQFIKLLLETSLSSASLSSSSSSSKPKEEAPVAHTLPPKKHRKPVSRKVRRRDWIQQLLWTSYCYRQVNSIESFDSFGGNIPRPSDLESYSTFLRDIQEHNDNAEQEFFSSVYPTPSFEDYQFHLQQSNQSNGWLLKSVAGRLAQCRSVGACWDQIFGRMPGMKEFPDVAWQVLCDLMESGCLLVGPHDLSAVDFVYLELETEQMLSICWKDRQVTSNRALDLLKLMTTQQQEIFDAIGVTFPSWVGRPLAFKDLAHALTQYNKYLKIQSDMKKQIPGDHRFLLSKSIFDASKPCRFCDQQPDEGIFCDACLCFYCKACEPETCALGPPCWVCNLCKDLDQLQYMD